MAASAALPVLKFTPVAGAAWARHGDGGGGGGGGGAGPLQEKSYVSSLFGPPHSAWCGSPPHGVPGLTHPALGLVSAAAAAASRSLRAPQKHRAPPSTPATASPALPHAAAQLCSATFDGGSPGMNVGSTGALPCLCCSHAVSLKHPEVW